MQTYKYIQKKLKIHIFKPLKINLYNEKFTSRANARVGSLVCMSKLEYEIQRTKNIMKLQHMLILRIKYQYYSYIQNIKCYDSIFKFQNKINASPTRCSFSSGPNNNRTRSACWPVLCLLACSI